MSRDCRHGHLARSCELCEAERDVAERDKLLREWEQYCRTIVSHTPQQWLPNSSPCYEELRDRTAALLEEG